LRNCLQEEGGKTKKFESVVGECAGLHRMKNEKRNFPTPKGKRGKNPSSAMEGAVAQPGLKRCIKKRRACLC